MHPMLVPQTKPGGVPHRLLEASLEILEVLGGLGRFGRILTAVLHGCGRSGRALGRLLDGLGGMLGGLGQVLGVMLGLKMVAKFGSYRKSITPRGRRVHSFFLMDFASKLSSP